MVAFKCLVIKANIIVKMRQADLGEATMISHTGLTVWQTVWLENPGAALESCSKMCKIIEARIQKDADRKVMVK